MRFSLSSHSITLKDISAHPIPFIWLRDACQAPQSVHPSTRQKLFRTDSLPHDIRPAQNGIRTSQAGLHITWNDGHKSLYSPSFLTRYLNPSSLASFHRDPIPRPWLANQITSSPHLFINYSDIRNVKHDSSPIFLSAVHQLSTCGLLVVRGIPNDETDNKTCELRTLAGLFGEIRPTFYGETWDVINVPASTNIAYTNLDLGLHMDLLYFAHPPRYQILHCLRNRVNGGTSIFSDGLRASHALHASDPRSFQTLANTPVAFHYINDGHHLHHLHPTIELAPFQSLSSTSTAPPQVSYINYSPPFQAPLPISTPPEFFPALRAFAAHLHEDGAQLEYTLQEGDAVIFDNRRVLHARSAFWEKESGKRESLSGNHANEPNRWLKGCYLEADALLDRYRMLRTRLEKDI